MLPMLIAGFLLLACLLLFIRWFAAADPRTLTFAAKAVGAAVLVTIAAFLLLTGRIAWIIGLFPFLLPFLLRKVNLGAAGNLGSFAGRAQPRMSNVRTQFLEMRLDHETGELDGEILLGPHAGRQMSAISTDDLLQLLHWLRAKDRKSALLLEAYLDRRCADWRNKFSDQDPHHDREQNHSDSAGAMSVKDAYHVLGLEPGAGDAEIREAYHRLISSVHPDKGGSSFLAAQVNRAKDILLGGKSGR